MLLTMISPGCHSRKCIFHETSPICCFVHTDKFWGIRWLIKLHSASATEMPFRSFLQHCSSHSSLFNCTLDIYQIRKGSIPLWVLAVVYCNHTRVQYLLGLLGFILRLDCQTLFLCLRAMNCTYGTTYKLGSQYLLKAQFIRFLCTLKINLKVLIEFSFFNNLRSRIS